MCKGNNCKKQGIYNYKGETKPLYCFSCKLDNMIDVIHHKCIICNNNQTQFKKVACCNNLICNNCAKNWFLNESVYCPYCKFDQRNKT